MYRFFLYNESFIRNSVKFNLNFIQSRGSNIRHWMRNSCKSEHPNIKFNVYRFNNFWYNACVHSVYRWSNETSWDWSVWLGSLRRKKPQNRRPLIEMWPSGLIRHVDSSCSAWLAFPMAPKASRGIDRKIFFIPLLWWWYGSELENRSWACY
jgi:hypothetical protein